MVTALHVKPREYLDDRALGSTSVYVCLPCTSVRLPRRGSKWKEMDRQAEESVTGTGPDKQKG